MLQEFNIDKIQLPFAQDYVKYASRPDIKLQLQCPEKDLKRQTSSLMHPTNCTSPKQAPSNDNGPNRHCITTTQHSTDNLNYRKRCATPLEPPSISKVGSHLASMTARKRSTVRTGRHCTPSPCAHPPGAVP